MCQLIRGIAEIISAEKRTFVILAHIGLVIDDGDRPDRVRTPLRTYPHRLGYLFVFFQMTAVGFLTLVHPVRGFLLFDFTAVLALFSTSLGEDLLNFVAGNNVECSVYVGACGGPFDVWSFSSKFIVVSIGLCTLSSRPFRPCAQ